MIDRHELEREMILLYGKKPPDPIVGAMAGFVIGGVGVPLLLVLIDLMGMALGFSLISRRADLGAIFFWVGVVAGAATYMAFKRRRDHWFDRYLELKVKMEAEAGNESRP